MAFSKSRLIVVLPFIVGGAALMLAPWFTMYTITCDRLPSGDGRCFIWQSVLSIKTHELPLSALHQAATRSRFSGRSASYWVVLQASTGDIRLPAASIPEPTDQVKTRLNSFLAIPQQKTLKVTQDDRQQGLIRGVLLWGFGAIALQFAIWFAPD